MRDDTADPSTGVAGPITRRSHLNHRTDSGHVERFINETEAAVVCRIFELCTKGFGQIAIAKKRNAAPAPAPRSQQGRPHACASSSVCEVLYGICIGASSCGTRPGSGARGGQVKATDRPESEWLRASAPELRIIPESVWTAAHARLAQSRESYLRATGGRLWGRPLDGIASLASLALLRLPDVVVGVLAMVTPSLAALVCGSRPAFLPGAGQ